eukprot:1160484-Pelagomonas_calceolata.AAC.8
MIEKYYTEVMSAVNIKNGKYLPEEAPRNYPWEQAGKTEPVPDPFTLQPQITKEEQEGVKQRDWLYYRILDK